MAWRGNSPETARGTAMALVFLSSTDYDLIDVRAELKQLIEGADHRVSMSDHGTTGRGDAAAASSTTSRIAFAGSDARQ